MNNIKKDFPILKRKIGTYPLIYLDNASATQKPTTVLQAVDDYYKKHNSNVHRAVHQLGIEATEIYEHTREHLAKFLTTKPQEIVYTTGTTHGLNIVAYGLLPSLPKKSEILTTQLEHHSNFVPWQHLSKHYGHTFTPLPLTPEGNINTETIAQALTKKTRILAISHASNVTGKINDIKNITKIAHDNNTLIIVDGAQATPSMPVNLKQLDVDYYTLSGQKMLAPTGTGILYGKEEHLEHLAPYHLGGGMIKNVGLQKTTWNDIPAKHEAGTPNIGSIAGITAALTYLKKKGMTTIYDYEKKLSRKAHQQLAELPYITIYGQGELPIISFNLDNIHPHDLATALNMYGIAVRAGHHCCQPLMNHFKTSAVTRASFYIYNTEEDLQQLTEKLQTIKRHFTC
ncbi:MAG TPA: SufS family cysteine desulfurase [Candidatus Nanoarchaeia archaeon]|nr:SufS family cysteine desulfurase [Candidatus Nanoarchaeia archaeon]